MTRLETYERLWMDWSFVDYVPVLEMGWLVASSRAHRSLLHCCGWPMAVASAMTCRTIGISDRRYFRTIC